MAADAQPNSVATSSQVYCFDAATARPTSPTAGQSGSEGTFEPGSAVWIQCPEQVWRPATVVSTQGDGIDAKVTVEIAGGRPGSKPNVVELFVTPGGGAKAKIAVNANVPQVLPRDSSLKAYHHSAASGCADLSQLSLLHEAAILQALDARFRDGVVYTFTGPVLLAVNPFRTISDLYCASKIAYFAELPADAEPNEPHIFSIARAAYRGVWDRGAQQTVLVSGESGAGKTETTKFVMRFLAMAGTGGTEACMSSVERRVLQSIPLLESLGNAKTLRNNNSSRFGKYIELQFGSVDKKLAAPRLVGAFTHTYLLEKVRVVGRQPGERNFHIFYQAFAAAARVEKDDVRLRGALGHIPQDFAYLSLSDCYQMGSSTDEAADFDESMAALSAFGVSSEDSNTIMDVILAVLHLGNLQFSAAANNSEGSDLPPSQEKMLSGCCNLLGLDPVDLTTCLCQKTMKTPGEGVISMPVLVSKATESRDALARHLYGAVFAYVVARVNQAISSNSATTNGSGGRPSTACPCVGVLDIFGFEFFERNSLEQLFINYTNELLQQYFNEVIFQNETVLYAREGIQWDPRDFPDNTTIVDFIGKEHIGVLAMLDEECVTVGGCSERWCSKLQHAHGLSHHFDVVRYRPGNFEITHFAGKVEYESRDFLEKNRDLLGVDIVSCLKGSDIPFVRQLFVENDRSFGVQESSSAGRRPRIARAKQYSVASEFTGQLRSLMSRIRSTEPHFVRCLKPNAKNVPNAFDRGSVVEQLRYQGVLQSVEVSRAGFPQRMRHRHGVLRFRCLCPEVSRLQVEAECARCNFASAAHILFDVLSNQAELRLPRNVWAVGASKIFLKREAVQALGTALGGRRRLAAICVQAVWRQVLRRRWYTAARRSVIALQARCRGNFARQRARLVRRLLFVIKIQAFARGAVARHRCRLRHAAAARIQRVWRSFAMRRWLSRVLTSVLELQRWWKRMFLLLRLRRGQQAAIRIQSRWRGRCGRKVVAVNAAIRKTQQRIACDWHKAWRLRTCDRILRECHVNSKNGALHVEDLDTSKFSAGELTAAVAELAERVERLEGESELLLQRRAVVRQEVADLGRWTPLGVMRRVTSFVFGGSCGEAASDPLAAVTEEKCTLVSADSSPLGSEALSLHFAQDRVRRNSFDQCCGMRGRS